MARDSRIQFNEIADKLEPSVRRAFLAAIDAVTRSVKIKDIETALRLGDIDRVVKLLGIGPEMAAPLAEAVETAFVQGGKYMSATFPATGPDGSALVVYFQGRHPRAEQILLSRSGGLIQGIGDSIRKSVRLVAQEGLSKGHNPRKIALDLVGRVDPVTGRRKGGIVGLTEGQTDYVLRMREELSGSQINSNYFTRQRRDKRFDALVRKAMREGKPLSPKKVDQIVTRYSDRLLQLRGENIARTEVLGAMSQGRSEAVQQLIDTGRVKEKFIKKIWKTSSDGRVRDDHNHIHNVEVAWGEKFESGTGAYLDHPRDPEGPAEDVINCRCWMEIRIDWIGARREERLAA